MRLLLLITCFYLYNLANAQIEVKGIIKDKSGKGLAGVSVIEKGTYNGVVSDLNGFFTLKCESQNPVLSFAFIGYVTQKVEITSERNITIILEEDIAVFNCPDFERYFHLGLQSGLENTPLGVQIDGLFPAFFRWRPLFYANLEWRTNNNENDYLRTDIRKTIFDLITAEIDIHGQLKNINRENIHFREYTLSSGITYRTYSLSFGFTEQEISKNDQIISQNGFHIGLRKDFGKFLRSKFYFDLNAKLINDSWQTSAELRYNFYKLNLAAGLGYEDNREFQTYKLAILYRIRY